MNGRDALPALARDNKEQQPWKHLSDAEQVALMDKLAKHKSELSSVKTGDRTVGRDVEGTLDRLNSEVSNRCPLSTTYTNIPSRLRALLLALVLYLHTR